ncbi:recQ-mediated genome instability protein 1 [Sarracenia purpurea var. burkii]
MTRRRLRIHYSSSEEEDEVGLQQQLEQQEHLEHQEDDDDIEVELQEPTLDLESATLNTPNPNPGANLIPSCNSSVPVQLEISDDDFVEVAENLSSPSPPSAPPVTDQSFQSSFSSRINISDSAEASDCPIRSFLARLGLNLRREWLDSCIRGLESSVPRFGILDLAAKAKLCFEQFLYSDMNYSGAGMLPENVHNMHLEDLAGPFILQVDEIVNISCPLKGRYQNANSGLKRCLKLSMTDGVQRVFGMEYRPIKDLEVLAPAGLKVAICNVNIRHGLLMLVPEIFEVLGGQVEDLEAARQRLVDEVNKPPRGKRTRTGVVPPLATRATLAAWPPDNVSAPGHTTTPVSQAASHQAAEQELSILEEILELSLTLLFELVKSRVSGISTRERTTEDFAGPVSMENAEPNSLSTLVSDIDDVHMVDEVDHPFILTGEYEMPFTYLASLSAKWASVRNRAPNVHGIIKVYFSLSNLNLFMLSC